MAESIIAPFYHLQNFLTALAWVQTRYADLLDKSEPRFIQKFQQFDQPSARHAMPVDVCYVQRADA